MTETEWNYRFQRDRNNEASKKSRMNRREKEFKLEEERRALEMRNEDLVNEERELIKKLEKWKQAVLKIAQM